jgi:hypothetical protein
MYYVNDEGNPVMSRYYYYLFINKYYQLHQIPLNMFNPVLLKIWPGSLLAHSMIEGGAKI